MAVDPRQMILQMMMQQGGGMPEGMPPGVDPQMASMMRNMDTIGANRRPSEGGGGGGGGGTPFGRGRQMPPQMPLPPSQPPAMGPPMAQGVPAHPYEGMSQGYPEQEMMDESAGAGLPPQIMALAAQGIRPGDMGMPMPPNEPPGAMMPPRGDYSRGKAHVGPESRDMMTPSDEDPDIDPDEYDGRVDPGSQAKYDPRFGPIKDQSREETEGEIEAVRNSMSERSIQAIEDDIREAAEAGDTSAIEVLLEEMDEQGYEIAELPPDVQKMINVQDEENARPTVEPDNED